MWPPDSSAVQLNCKDENGVAQPLGLPDQNDSLTPTRACRGV
jgi:hypothetical protein